MNLFQTLILAVVEGLTEFLPISSTGHLILTTHLLQIPQTEFVKTFEIIIQLGAILAVVVLYFKRILTQSKTLAITILSAFIPTGIIGVLLYKTVKNYLLGNDLLVVGTLIIGGIALILIDKHLFKHPKTDTLESLTIQQSAIIGAGQALAMVPGVSRSAATIITAGLLGIDKKTAVEFSFLLAIPTMVAATAFDLANQGFTFTRDEATVLLVGFIGAFITALFAIKLFVGYVQKNGFSVFGYYRIGLGIIYLFVMYGLR